MMNIIYIASAILVLTVICLNIAVFYSIKNMFNNEDENIK